MCKGLRNYYVVQNISISMPVVQTSVSVLFSQSSFPELLNVKVISLVYRVIYSLHNRRLKVIWAQERTGSRVNVCTVRPGQKSGYFHQPRCYY